MPVHGGPRPPCIIPISNGLLSPVRCPFIQSITAAKVRGNVEPQTLENRRNRLFICVRSRVGRAWSLLCPKTGRNVGQKVRMTFRRKDWQPDA